MSLNHLFQEVTKNQVWQKIVQALDSETTYKIASPNSLFPIITNLINYSNSTTVLAVTSNKIGRAHV